VHRHANQRGAALILLLGITFTLAILSATLVFVIGNQQRATASDRSSKQSLYAAEAALDSAIQFAKVDQTMSTTVEWLKPSDLATAFAGVFPAGATVTYRVYDNLATVNYNVKWDQGGPSLATTPDHMVWVEAEVIYQGKTTRTRVLVQQTTEPFAAALPKTVTYSDTGIMLKDHSDIYAVNADGTPDTSGSPYPTAISAGGTWIPSMSSGWAEVGRFTANSYSDLAAPTGGGVQSLGIKANGSVSLAGHSFTDVAVAPGTVGFLSDYFDQAAQASLADESQDANNPIQANAAGTSVASTYFTTSGDPDPILSVPGVTYDSASMTYTFANDLVVTGDLTLSSGTFPAGTVFKFKSLYATGSLTLTDEITLNTTALYVGKNFTISNGTTTAVKHWLGSVFVPAFSSSSNPSLNHGDVDWSGKASVTSRDYTQQTDPNAVAAQPKPMWLGRYWERTGTYADEYGNIWVPGNSSTSIVLGSSGASTIMCPLLCTTERTTVSGNITFGSRTKPMVYFFMCDNNGIYPQVVDWAGTGTYYGLMVINESTIDIRNGVSGGPPSIEGAVFAGCPYDPTHTSGLSMSDIVIEDYSSIAYNQTVVGAIATSSLKTTTVVTQAVPGSWQQLPAN
jgi:hypothetical protein